jgi:hypothetical protein
MHVCRHRSKGQKDNFFNILINHLLTHLFRKRLNPLHHDTLSQRATFSPTSTLEYETTPAGFLLIPTFIDTVEAIDEIPSYDSFEPAPDDF